MVEDQKEKKQTRNDIVWQAIAPMIVIIFLVFAIGVLVGYVDTPENQMAVILSTVAIGLSLAIFVIQQIQGGKLQGVVDEVHRFTNEGDRLLKEKREVYADSIVVYQQVFRKKFNEAFEIEKSIKDTKKDKKAVKKAAKDIQLLYRDIAQNRRPTYTTMEMVDVFGKNIGGFWNEFLKNASFDERFSTKDEELDEVLQFGLFMNCNTILQIIVENVLIHASEKTKKKIGN